jgi:hypothetical protein
MGLTIKIKNGDKIYEPPIKDSPSLKRQKNGVSVFDFTLINDELIKIEEGDVVTVVADDLRPFGAIHNIFYGFVFRISTSKNGEVNITAYDQIRYLQNTDTLIYSDKRLNELLRIICDNTKIKAGADIMDTGYIIPSRIEDNKSYLDMIMTAIELTVQNGGREFILWDNFGEIALHDTEFHKIGLTINKDTAQDFSFETSIDGETYNQIKLHREAEDGTREVFIKSDPDKINKWGLLQNSENLNKDENGDAKAQSILDSTKYPTRTWSVSGAFGDVRVRGGTTLHVQLDMVDMGYKENGKTVDFWMMVESVTHTFASNNHTMDLELKGGFAG